MVGIEILVHFIVLQSAIEKKNVGSIVRILLWLIFGRLKVKTQIYRVQISSSHWGLC